MKEVIVCAVSDFDYVWRGIEQNVTDPTWASLVYLCYVYILLSLPVGTWRSPPWWRFLGSRTLVTITRGLFELGPDDGGRGDLEVDLDKLVGSTKCTVAVTSFI